MRAFFNDRGNERGPIDPRDAYCGGKYTIIIDKYTINYIILRQNWSIQINCRAKRGRKDFRFRHNQSLSIGKF